MPRLSEPVTTAATVEFIASVPLDLMNAMYFTSLVEQTEGIDDWPQQVRKQMSRELLDELDYLFTFPKGDPGVLGALTDHLLAHPEAWTDVDALVRFVENLPPGIGESPNEPGIQGLAFYTACSQFECAEQGIDPKTQSREALIAALKKSDADVDSVLAVYDRPEELRSRMVRLIERFYSEHYRHELPRRLHDLDRSVTANRDRPVGDINELARRLTGRVTSCLETECSAPYTKLIFVPSLDMGPYISCANVPPVHGLFYPCETEFTETAPEEAEETRRMARIYKALSDEQRLRILNLLREKEMYAQEIVDRLNLHQSAVSRHLSFLNAVGLVNNRRENNMKFFTLNPDIRDVLAKTLNLFASAEP
jgi:DNA-binding transcriptional ArsR family regulator